MASSVERIECYDTVFGGGDQRAIRGYRARAEDGNALGPWHLDGDGVRLAVRHRLTEPAYRPAFLAACEHDFVLVGNERRRDEVDDGFVLDDDRCPGPRREEAPVSAAPCAAMSGPTCYRVTSRMLIRHPSESPGQGPGGPSTSRR